MSLILLVNPSNSDSWSEWTSWTTCIGECSFSLGTKFRNRTCHNKTTEFGTDACPTENNQTVNCDPDWGSDDCPLGKGHPSFL